MARSVSKKPSRTAKPGKAQRKSENSGKRASTHSKILTSRTAFDGKVFSVSVEQVVEPSGIRVQRDTVRHSGSVVVIPVDDTSSEPRVLLERQYRYPADDYLWEFPAGRIDSGEDALAAGKRELIEETGFTAKRWKKALFFYASPGFLDETMTVFVAQGLTRGEARPEADEVIRMRFFPLSAAVNMARNGKIRDGKTIAGLLWLDARIASGSK